MKRVTMLVGLVALLLVLPATAQAQTWKRFYTPATRGVQVWKGHDQHQQRGHLRQLPRRQRCGG